jgi:hypothetical protein
MHLDERLETLEDGTFSVGRRKAPVAGATDERKR